MLKQFYYEPIGNNFTVKDFDEIDRRLDNLNARKVRMIRVGINAHQALEDALKDCFMDTNIDYAQAQCGNSDNLLALVMNPKYLVKSGAFYMVMRFPINDGQHDPDTISISYTEKK